MKTLQSLGYTKKQSAQLIKPTNTLTIGTHQKNKLTKEANNHLYDSREKIGVPFDQTSVKSYPLKKQIQIMEKSNKETTALLTQEINEYSNYLTLKNIPYELKFKNPIYALSIFNDLIKYDEKILENIEYKENTRITLTEKKGILLTILNDTFEQMKKTAIEEGVDPAFFNGLDENILKKLNDLEIEINRVKKKKEEEKAKAALSQNTLSQISEPGNSAPQGSGAITYVNGILVVNKKHPLPASYNPGENATAGSEIRRLIADMQRQGLDVSNGYSGFRSYSYQASLY